MNKPASVFFTGMDSFDAEQLAALFQDANRRTGNHWHLASDLDSAAVVVIDVDTLSGHMSWLRSQTSGQTVVALTTGASARADHVLHRPVTMDAMRRLLHNLRSQGNSGAAPEHTDAPANVTPAAASEPPAPITATPPVAEVAVAAIPAAPAPVNTTPEPIALTAPASDASPGLKLIDALLAGTIAAGPQVLELPGLQPLALDMTQKVFLCGSGIKSYLPHTKVVLDENAWKPLSDSEFEALGKTLGGSQPLSRLLWLAALGGSDGVIPGAAAEARYRLSRWPQIEREFPRHFRIATCMMKGFLSPDEIAGQSNASVAEVNEFIVASMVAGYAEAEEPAPSPEQTVAPAPRSLLERLRGAR